MFFQPQKSRFHFGLLFYSFSFSLSENDALPLFGLLISFVELSLRFNLSSFDLPHQVEKDLLERGNSEKIR